MNKYQITLLGGNHVFIQAYGFEVLDGYLFLTDAEDLVNTVFNSDQWQFLTTIPND